MISLDQVQLLEQKVEIAVTKIADLNKENDFLKKKFSELKHQNEQLLQKTKELEEMIVLYEEDQSRIEKGILSALNRLNEIEDAVVSSDTMPAQKPAEPIVNNQAAAFNAESSGAVHQPAPFVPPPANQINQTNTIQFAERETILPDPLFQNIPENSDSGDHQTSQKPASGQFDIF